MPETKGFFSNHCHSLRGDSDQRGERKGRSCLLQRDKPLLERRRLRKKEEQGSFVVSSSILESSLKARKGMLESKASK